MNRKQFKILFLILILAAALRLFALGSGDAVNDEVLIAFRAIGLMDFDLAEFQTTPLEWFDPAPFRECENFIGANQEINSQSTLVIPKHCSGRFFERYLSLKGVGLDPDIPSWTKLSFHDHPPLVFWIQHIFIKIFGENNFGFRLPSALLGIASVYLLYLIGKQLYGFKTGAVSALIFAVTLSHVHISRIGLQESYVIFFLLLGSYLFMKALKNDKYFILTGGVLGLALLTKYTAFVLVPIFLTHLVLFRRDCLRSKKLWLGVLLSTLIFSPVFFYNLKLYQRVGHFDFQFSYLFGQNPEVWKVAPGKEIGSFSDRIGLFIPRLISSYSWLFLAAFGASAAAFLRQLVKKAKAAFLENKFLLIAVFYLVLLILFVGPSYRFLSMLTPFMALGIGKALGVFYEKFTAHRRLALAVFCAVIGFEIFYTVNNQIFYTAFGAEPWLASKSRYENYNWGYNQLEEFIGKELKGKMPAQVFVKKYEFLQKLQLKSLDKAREEGLIPYPALIIYDHNIFDFAQLWILNRRLMYHGWPIVDTETYLSILEKEGEDYFEKSGFRNFYFIIPTDNVLLRKAERLTDAGASFEENLKARNLTPIKIVNRRGEEIFRVYKF